MQVVKQTASRQEFGDHIVLIIINAHSHVKDNAWMEKFIYYLDLFNKMADMLISKPFLFQVLFDCNLLTQPFTKINLTITTLSNWLDNFDLLLWNEEIQFDTFFGHVSLYFSLHVLLRFVLLPLSSLFLLSLLFLSLLFLFLSFTVGRRV